ncbi:MAG TPA: 16S rRNA (adenine(1518)-N(6)/adenine(1519)-N(6))-dimethyltransferase RsmA [Leucothrix mucor]|nr:16S rRNA (adenine(1518)-N(6)/adenine(1519)-N(6))-dimethyltransferase RsmA [Leucothrix mucor]
MPQHEYRTKKRFGQHFLHDHGVIHKLIQYINPKNDQQIIEIGPGMGALTFPLLEHIQHMEVIEIDRDVIKHLHQFGGDRLTIHNIDALKFNLEDLLKDNQQMRIVGNLPYNISTPLIFHLLKYQTSIEDMHFMLQKEVVDRITAKPGSKTYGRLSVMVQYYCKTEYLFYVGPEAFNPPPKVDSAVIRLQPWMQKPYLADNVEVLAKVVAQAFSMRRKTLRNTLKKLFTSEQIESVDINPSVRAETLSVKNFVDLSNLITLDELIALQ